MPQIKNQNKAMQLNFDATTHTYIYKPVNFQIMVVWCIDCEMKKMTLTTSASEKGGTAIQEHRKYNHRVSSSGLTVYLDLSHS